MRKRPPIHARHPPRTRHPLRRVPRVARQSAGSTTIPAATSAIPPIVRRRAMSTPSTTLGQSRSDCHQNAPTTRVQAIPALSQNAGEKKPRCTTGSGSRRSVALEHGPGFGPGLRSGARAAPPAPETTPPASRPAGSDSRDDPWRPVPGPARARQQPTTRRVRFAAPKPRDTSAPRPQPRTPPLRKISFF